LFEIAATIMTAIDGEFRTVDIILACTSETRGVDAFALSLIKAERQVRRIFTHLIYQFPAFGPNDIDTLRSILAQRRRVYFEGFLSGIDALYAKSVQEVVGTPYASMRQRVDEATDHRNKIFHGQLTATGLTRDDLIRLCTDIRCWCEALATAFGAEIGYDGFERNSFRKSQVPDLLSRCRVQIGSVADYCEFMRKNMERGTQQAHSHV
jgi:hypothetical protein